MRLAEIHLRGVLSAMKPNHISAILLVILLMTDACWSQCRNANWWGSFDAQGWSTCDSTAEYLTGFYRNHQLSGDPIYLLEEATCCKAPAPNQDQASTCMDANWWGVLDSINVWAVCPNGFFMQGLYRTSGHNLHNIEAGRCCKPDNLPNGYLSCSDHDVGSSFDNQGWHNCADGYYLAGIYKGGCNVLHCIEKFRCCKMEADIGLCAPAPCKNGATCVDLVASYRCDCAPGWLGITCEDPEVDNCQQV